MIKRTLLLAIVAAVMAACSASVAPRTAGPTDAPTSTPAPTRTDDERTAVIQDTIDELWCGSKPIPSWCKSMTKIDGSWNVAVFGGTLIVVTKLHDTDKAKKTAGAICGALAFTAQFDETGEPLGIRHVDIYDTTAKHELAKCEPPE